MDAPSYGPIEEDEPVLIECRMCGTVELVDDWTHACPYASAPMPVDDECELLAVLARWSDAKHWPGPSRGWAIDSYRFEGWTIAVFFDGTNSESWDYVDHVVSPDGVTYRPWPQRGERGLPVSIAYWQPTKPPSWSTTLAGNVRDAMTMFAWSRKP